MSLAECRKVESTTFLNLQKGAEFTITSKIGKTLSAIVFEVKELYYIGRRGFQNII